jgi:hypothetical protein
VDNSSKSVGSSAKSVYKVGDALVDVLVSDAVRRGLSSAHIYPPLVRKKNFHVDYQEA